MVAVPPPACTRTARLAARKARRVRIIAEIRRLAAENGGTPPGLRLFSTRTGIPLSACKGIIWPRWSDALKEAGFAPNPPEPRLDNEYMLNAIAEIARFLGRLPNASDLAAWRGAGRPLPAHSTYTRHFGSMGGIFRALKRWAAEDPGRADIAVMLADTPDAPEPERVLPGAVYLLRHGRSYKIGCTRKMGQRVGYLLQILPARAKLVHAIRTDDPHGIEAYWHRRFAEKRTRGEWFRLSREDVAAFRERQYQ